MGQRSSRPVQNVKARTPEEWQRDVELASEMAKSIKDENGRVFTFSCVLHDNGLNWKAHAMTYVTNSPPQPGKTFQKCLNYQQFYKFFFQMLPYASPEIQKRRQGGQSSTTDQNTDSPTSSVQSGDQLDDDSSECTICMDQKAQIVLPECSHAFCEKCIEEWSKRNPTCPLCRGNTGVSEDQWILTDTPSSQDLYRLLEEMLQNV